MKTLLALMAGTLVFSSCNDEDALNIETPNVAPEVEGIRTFKAFTENDGATRATIDGLSVKWQSGDAITVVNENAYSKYVLSAGANTTLGSFDYSVGDQVSGSGNFAVYPYDDGMQIVQYEDALYAAYNLGASDDDFNKYLAGYTPNRRESELQDLFDAFDNDEVIQAYYNETPLLSPFRITVSEDVIEGLVFPATQRVPSGQMVDPKVVMMVAKADTENNFTFRNVCSYIKVTTTTPLYQIKAIAITNEREEGLNGTFDVDLSSGTPVILEGGRGNYNYLEAAEGNLAPGTYYIAVLPGTLSGGFSIQFYTDNTTYTESKRTNSITFERSMVYDGGTQPAAVDAAQWTMYTTYQDWINPTYSRDMTSLYIQTGQSAPDGEDATVVYLNGEHTLWSRYDAGTTTAYIETNKSVIVATSLSETFRSFTRLTSISGLDNIDVSNVSNFGSCFSGARLTSLDLSQWQIKNGANTNLMFRGMMVLEELRINSTFPAGTGMFQLAGQYDYMGGPCKVYGASADLKSADDTTDREADRMVWAD